MLGLSINHFSLQSNHLHLIVEAKNNEVLTRGMRSFTVTFAKEINKGRVQLERYHLHVLKTLQETKNAVKYVLLNEQKHKNSRQVCVDEFSSLGNLRHILVLNLIKQERLALVWNQVRSPIDLETGRSWLLKNALI